MTSALNVDDPERHTALICDWLSLDDAGRAIARLAEIPLDMAPTDIDDFTASIDRLPIDAQELVETSIGDMVAIMQPGLEALLRVVERDRNAAAAARILYREWDAARTSIMQIVLPVDDIRTLHAA